MAALNSIQGLGFVGSTRIVLMVCASRSAVSSPRAVSTKTAPMTSVASTRNQNVHGSLDAIHQGVAAAIHIVELGLGHGIVHVNGLEE